MKRVSWIFILIIGFVVAFTACEDDEEPDPGADAPSISSITPNTGAPGTAVTIAGSNFGSSPTVKFGTTDATVSNATATSISTTVPSGLAAGAVDVTVTTNGQTSSAVSFTVEEEDPDPNAGHPYAEEVVENGKILFGSITEDRTLYADSVYYLDGYVFVESGTLTIEPGTVIMGFEEPSDVSEGNETSLIITREAMIDAEGTAEDPIIFTSELDEEALGGEPNLTPFDSKLWAGVIILGKANIFSEGATEVQIEGIPDGEARALYGGDDVEHSSGILKYVSIRFTGAEIGPGDEIQGLTLGGVGGGTVIEDIDIFVSADDGIEIFGGTVNIKRISVAFAEDDAFDFDIGWSGFGQYLFALQGGNEADHGGEWDGAKPDNADSYTNARIYNATFIGQGLDATTERGVEAAAIIQRDGAALSLYNSIITDFDGVGLEIEDRSEDNDSFDKLVNQEINTIAGNIWYTGNAGSIEDMMAITEADDTTPRESDAASVVAHLNANNNVFVDPELAGISREGDGGLNPVPGAAAATENVVTELPDDEADAPSYKGAFDPAGDLWISTWTTLARFGFLE